MELLAEALHLLPTSIQRLVIVLRSDSDPRFLEAVPKQWPFFGACWMRHATVNYSGRKLLGNEIAYTFGEPVRFAEGRRVIPMMAPVSTKSSKSAGHPTPRSVTHMRFLVNWWTDRGETVLDPFAGSGTTGVAADHLGRDAILIEQNPDYANGARQRLADVAPLFDEAGT